MKVRIKFARLVIPVLLGAAWSVPAPAGAFTTNIVEKVADLNAGLDNGGNIFGGYNPESHFTQVGTNLWFTTTAGGLNGDGTVSTFSLVSHQVTQIAYLDKNTSGKLPDSPLLVIDGTNGYFTTQQGGSTSNKGAIVKIDLPSGALTTLHAFTNTDGANPHTGVTKIGNDLWTMTALGGASSKGTIVKYSLDTGITTVVTNFDGPKIGGYPYANPVYYNSAWYFTAFVGGTNSPSGAPLGTGAFDRLTFDDQGNPLITKLIDLPDGFPRAPCGTPVLVGTNSFYFLTVGPNSNPGAVVRYDLDTGFWTNLFNFSTNTAVDYGKQPGYNGLTEWQGELYFLSRQGGTSNYGVVAKFNIASNAVVKLADLDGNKGPLALGNEVNGFNNDGLVVLETNRFFIYYTVYAGGVNGSGSGYGTILRIYLPPLPIQTAIAPADPGILTLSWSGGYPPFDVVTNNDLSVPLTNWPAAITGLDSAVNTTNWSTTLPVPGGITYYRIRGQAQ